MTDRSPVPIVDAAIDLADALAPNWDMLDSSWITFGCSEIELFAALFRATGNLGLAEQCVLDHAQDDDEGDDHFALRIQR